MHQNELNDRWDDRETAAEEVAVIEREAGDVAGRSEGVAVAEPGVLARVPDLAAADSRVAGAASRAKGDGRILGAKTSTKLLVGAGVLLVVVAIGLPKLLGTGEQEGGKPPRPDAKPAPDYNPAAQASGTSSDSKGIPYQPPMQFNTQIPDLPSFAGQDANAGIAKPPSVPSWKEPEWSPTPQPVDEGLPNARRVPVSGPGVPERQNPPVSYGGQRSRRIWETEAAGALAATNRKMTVGQGDGTLTGVRPTNYRGNNPAESQGNFQYGGPSQSPQPAGPIARFEGTIETPSYRTASGQVQSPPNTYYK